jgi:hypothetical protein
MRRIQICGRQVHEAGQIFERKRPSVVAIVAALGKACSKGEALDPDGKTTLIAVWQYR